MDLWPVQTTKIGLVESWAEQQDIPLTAAHMIEQEWAVYDYGIYFVGRA